MTRMPGADLVSNGCRQTRERLALLEDALDPGTTRHLIDLGFAQGWHYLELGAGGGSIAAWLCGRVGPTGRVVATDVDTRFLEAIDCPRLEVWRHDLTADDLPERAFDLVHTRALLWHLPEPERALDQIVGALRPGGWVLIEEPDLACETMVAQSGAAVDLVDRVSEQSTDFWRLAASIASLPAGP
jgi:SAM-dependent methyltransferase